MKITLGNKSVWINFHHLYCFYVIAKSRTLQAASDELNIGQSALSIQIKNFEHQIGLKLFDRAARRLNLNEHGRMVFSYAKEIFRMGEEMIRTLGDQTSEKRVHLQIGSLDTIPKHLTIALAKQALAKGVDMTILEGGLAELFKDLMNNKTDLVLTNQIPRHATGVISRSLGRLPLWVVGTKNFLKLKKGFPNSLENQPFIVPTTESHVRHEFESFCEREKINIDLRVETEDLMVQKLLAVEGVGLTLMPEFAVKEFLKRKELYLVGCLPGIYEELFLASMKRKIQNPIASELIRTFRL